MEQTGKQTRNGLIQFLVKQGYIGKVKVHEGIESVRLQVYFPLTSPFTSLFSGPFRVLVMSCSKC